MIFFFYLYIPNLKNLVYKISILTNWHEIYRVLGNEKHPMCVYKIWKTKQGWKEQEDIQDVQNNRKCSWVENWMFKIDTGALVQWGHLLKKSTFLVKSHCWTNINIPIHFDIPSLTYKCAEIPHIFKIDIKFSVCVRPTSCRKFVFTKMGEGEMLWTDTRGHNAPLKSQWKEEGFNL